MSGFKASVEVEPMTYDFAPHAMVSGIVAEPSSDQIDAYRAEVLEGIKATGIDPAQLEGGKIALSQMDDLMTAASDMEKTLVSATATLTGIDGEMLAGLPYRVKAAFLGWIMGMFFSPEA